MGSGMQKRMRFIFILVMCLLLRTIFQHPDLQAQVPSDESDSIRKRSLFSIGFGLQHGFIFAHSPEVENTKGAHPTGVEGIFSWQRNDKEAWNLCNCFPRKGLLLAYYDFDRWVLGKGIVAAYFLEPVYRISRKTFFSVRGAIGFTYLSNPFDSIRNPTNRSYSTDISGYLLLGGSAWFRLTNHWWTNITLNYQHTSNGGFRQPNKGINWPTAGVSFHYYTKPATYYKRPRLREKFWKEKSMRCDAGVFGIAKRETDKNGNSSRFPLLGVYMQGSKQVGRINALTGSVEVFYDWALKTRLERDSIDRSPVRAGLLAGHEFILGKFLFSQRLGVYLYHNTPYFTRLYHRWGVQYHMNKHFGIGFHLNAHKHVADFVDLRMSYSWRRK
jgi:hypothetical protein